MGWSWINLGSQENNETDTPLDTTNLLKNWQMPCRTVKNVQGDWENDFLKGHDTYP